MSSSARSSARSARQRASRPASSSAPPSAARRSAAPRATAAWSARSARRASSHWSSRAATASAFCAEPGPLAACAACRSEYQRERPAGGQQQPHRRGQGQVHPPPLPLLAGLGLGLRPLPLGPHPVQLRGPGPLVGRGPQVGHRPRHLPRVGRPVGLLRRQAPLAQLDQARVGPAPSSRAKASPSLARAASWRVDSESAPTYGGRPVRTAHRMAPRPNTSLRASIWSTAPMACSGGMYAGVPSTLPVRVASPAPRSESIADAAAVASSPAVGSPGPAAGPRTLARPQSMTWTSPNAPTMTFAGFRSRWITPRPWA